MELKLYDTLTRSKRLFEPLDPARVRMYVCGPTVYDFAHIGNARPVIVFDVLFRLLRHLYGADHVVYVRNITDVDDKINARAAEEYPGLTLNEAIRKVTEKTEKQFHDDIDALGCLRPTDEPRATEFVRRNDGVLDMVTLIERLVRSGHAYVAEDHVLFDVPSMPDYGQLSKRPLDEMIAGARVEVAPYKRNPMDFILWKPSKPGEPAWPSPCGIEAPGRPGWHIECSAMSGALLGEIFDIHGGGIDLVFPHHENEIAQSRCAFHTPVMANYWMHNGFLQVEGDKMSKSTGNFVTIRELLADWPGEVLRLQMLSTHYRQPIDWTRSMTATAQNELEEWVHRISDIFGESIGDSKAERPISIGLIEALCDDLNTPEALSFLRQEAKKIGSDSEKALTFLCNCEFLNLMDRRHLGLLSREFGGEGATPELMVNAFDIYQSHRAKIHNKLPGAAAEFESQIRTIGAEVSYLKNGAVKLLPKGAEDSPVKAMIAARNAARARKDFKESDRIRDELAAMGVELEDHKDGPTTWKIKPVAP
jgi:cysteinyl-tRNA synthetase